MSEDHSAVRAAFRAWSAELVAASAERVAAGAHPILAFHAAFESTILKPAGVLLQQELDQDPSFARRESMWLVLAGSMRDFSGTELAKELGWQLFIVGSDFERLWEELVAAVDSKDVHGTLYAPLLNVRAELDSFELGPGLKFESIPAEVYPESGRYGAFPSGYGTHGLAAAFAHDRWVPKQDYLSPDRPDLRAAAAAQQQLRLAMLAFALVQSHPPTIELITSRGPTWLDQHGGRSYPNTGEVTVGIRQIEPSTLESWASFYQRVSRIDFKDAAFLDVALRRFSEGCRRPSIEDRLIDLTIAGEALFLTGIQDELKYRMAHRAGVWICDVAVDRAGVIRDFQDIYDARSSLVHGEPFKAKGNRTLPDLATMAETHMRGAMRKAVDWCASGRRKRGTRGLLDWDLAVNNALIGPGPV